MIFEPPQTALSLFKFKTEFKNPKNVGFQPRYDSYCMRYQSRDLSYSGSNGKRMKNLLIYLLNNLFFLKVKLNLP